MYGVVQLCDLFPNLTQMSTAPVDVQLLITLQNYVPLPLPLGVIKTNVYIWIHES
jgi:hypothetical protein